MGWAGRQAAGEACEVKGLVSAKAWAQARGSTWAQDSPLGTL